MLNLFKKKRQRVVIIGLDGTPYSLLSELVEKGTMPNLANICSQGYFGPMTVCLPEISSVSWTSFMTGVNSGEHGIYGFMDLKPGTYDYYFPNFLDLKAPTVFDELGRHDKRSIVINLPSTYPAREISGILISGFVAIDLRKAIYPSSIYPKLQELGYQIDVDVSRAKDDPDFLIKDLNSTLEARETVANHLWNDYDWDLFLLVITGTDRLHHYLFDAYEDNDHTYHQAFLEYYKKIDKVIGHFYELYTSKSRSAQSRFILLSDHGFTKIKSEIYLNRWLVENGYLRFTKEKPQSVADIDTGSKAFALDPSRIYINLKNKYPNGEVSQADYDGLREELKRAFLDLKFDGQPVLRDVFFKEELYKGPYLDRGPDMVLLSRHGFDLKGSVQKDTVFGLSKLRGMHTYDDAFFLSTAGEKCKSIFEVKKVVEGAFGIV